MGRSRSNSPTTTPTSSTPTIHLTARGLPTRASTDATTSQRSTRSASAGEASLESRRALILPIRPTARRSPTLCKDPLPESTRSTSAEGVSRVTPPRVRGVSFLGESSVAASSAALPSPPSQTATSSRPEVPGSRAPRLVVGAQEQHLLLPHGYPPPSTRAACTRSLILSLTERKTANRSSSEPSTLEGSSKVQCSLLPAPGKNGQASFATSSQTVIT